MARTQYNGVCVGGPYAGQQIVQDRETFKAISRLPGPVPIKYPPARRPDMRETATGETVYRHFEIAGCGVWLPDTKNPAYNAMQRLLSVYIAAAKEDRDD